MMAAVAMGPPATRSPNVRNTCTFSLRAMMVQPRTPRARRGSVRGVGGTLLAKGPAGRDQVATRVGNLSAEASSVSSAIDVGGPSWDLSPEYPSIECDEVEADLTLVEGHVERIAAATAASIEPAVRRAGEMTRKEAGVDGVLAALFEVSSLKLEAGMALANVRTLAFCESSVDAKSAEARALVSRVQALGAKMEAACTSHSLFLTLCSEDVLGAYLETSPATAEEAFQWEHARAFREHMLSQEEEAMLAKLKVSGHSAWGNMYDSISGSIVCNVALPSGPQEMGLAAAAGLLSSADEGERRAAWEGIQAGWGGHEEACAAALNAIAGWRLDVQKERGLDSFLAEPLHQNRLSPASLDAMMEAISARGDVARRGLAVQAEAFGKGALEPWDLFAPAPGDSTLGGGGEKYTWEEAIQVVKVAVSTLDASVGDFVQMMDDKRWIEARKGGSKKPGAYCTMFRRSRAPRVYISDFSGSAGDVLTLAHELGHAYHNWVMRDLPLCQAGYPMNLAETASLMFETVVGDALMSQASSPYQQFRFGWSDMEGTAAFLLNIPARFHFEQALYSRRAEGPLTPTQLSEQMQASLRHYYGESITRPDPTFWASKLHFYLTSVSFYNFPYSFGYLFALGVYAQAEQLGGEFFSAYTALLRDTGVMSSEALVLKHLGADITQRDFWDGSLDIVEGKVAAFEEAAREAGYIQ